ncbi:MAG: hypothetical protein ABJB49_04275 [Nitrospirota bacterium]
MKARTRWIALLILLGIWAGVALWVFTQSPEPQRAPLTYVSGQKAKREASRGKSVSGLHIQLGLLAANRQRTEKALGSPKNIFAPVFPGPRSFDMSGGVSNPVPVVQLTPEELALQAGRQELAQFRYLGYLSRGGRDEAFLAKGNALHIAKTGETIDQHILVKAISPAGVMLQETSTKTEQLVSPTPDMPGAPGPPSTGIMSPPSMPPPSFPGGGMMPPPGFSGSIPGNMGGPSFPGSPENFGGPQPIAPGMRPPPFSEQGR